MRYGLWAFGLMVMLVAGCVTERVVWSPDGMQAAVIGDDGLHVCDVDGKLSPALVTEVRCAEWMPDSKRLVVCRQRQFKTWKEAQQALPEEAAAAEKHTSEVRDALAAASGEWGAFVKEAKQKLKLSDEQLALAVMCVRDGSAGVLVLKLDKKGQEAYQQLSIGEDTAQIYRIEGVSATAGAVLYRRTEAGKGIQSVRVSPTGEGVLLSIDDGVSSEQGEPPQLALVASNGSGKKLELGRAAQFPDWSADGKYVVFITQADWNEGKKEALLGILARQLVAGENGQFLEPVQMPKREELAAVVFNELSRVRVAKDGRIFFSATEISLPAAVKDFENQATVFCFEPGKQATLTRVVPRGAMQTMGDAAQYFELSADGRYVSIPFNDGRVSVLDIASGEAQMVQNVAEVESKDRERLATIPVWRTATELTLVRPAANSSGHELVRYSMTENKGTVMSGNWPASVGGWLSGESGKESTNAKKN